MQDFESSLKGIEAVSISVYRNTANVFLFSTNLVAQRVKCTAPDVKQIVDAFSSCEGSCSTQHFRCGSSLVEDWTVASCCGKTELTVTLYGNPTPACTCQETPFPGNIISIRPCASDGCDEIQITPDGNGDNTCDSTPLTLRISVTYRGIQRNNSWLHSFMIF